MPEKKDLLESMPDQAELMSAAWWAELLHRFVEWAVTDGLKIILVLIFVSILIRISHLLIVRSVKLTVRPRGISAIDDLMVSKRQTTLIALFRASATIAFIGMAAMMIIELMGIAVGPLIASAGIVGVAIGFGAQNLVKDIISGAFIIIERQYSIGDVIKVGDFSGGVEEINLRTTILRAVDGSVHIIPNGKIDTVNVLTRDWSRLVLDLDIAYNADIRQASSIVEKVLQQYASENSDIVIEPPEVLGVQALGDSSVQLRAWMKVLPGKQWPAGRVLLERIKIAFDEAGIEIPFPQRTVWLRNDSSPSDQPKT